MKKVAILSIYYKNYNYGGQLQAYALQKAIQDLGYDSKQISYIRPRSFVKNKIMKFLNKSFNEKISLLGIYFNRFKLKVARFFNCATNTTNNLKKFDLYMQSIPHTSVVSSDNIVTLKSQFDVFVVGSDQVWNTELCPLDYFFPFLDNEYRISYSASIRKLSFSKKEKEKIIPLLNKFSYITVREKGAEKFLKELLPEKDISIIADPTFLLDEKSWSQNLKCELEDEYIFAYYIQKYSSKRKKTLIDFAKRNNLKVVYISNPSYYSNDKRFVKFEEGVGINEFLSLIKNAKYIITDSFHGTVFSIIFNKQFAVIGDIENDDRKKSLLSQFNLISRSIIDEVDLNILYNKIQYDMINIELCQLREQSLKILKDMIEKESIYEK